MTPGSTIVIGGGAAGLMAAGRAAELGADVILLEKMGQLGRKIGISGKGRCNLTNSAELNEFLHHFGKNGRFLNQCFRQFFTGELLLFLESRGLEIVLERGGRYFPASGRALDVVHIFNKWLKHLSVKVHLNSPVTKILANKKNGEITGVLCNDKELACKNVILATGGKSYPRTGSSGDGYKLLKELGHTITPLFPDLVPVESNHPQLEVLSGLNLRNIVVRLYIDGKRKGMEFGELSFTDSGLTGPTILNLSGRIVAALRQGRKVHLALDLKPALDEKKLGNRILRDLEKRKGEAIDSLLRGLLPKPLVDACLVECDIARDIDTKTFPAKVRKQLVRWLKDFRLELTAHGSWEESIITAGGLSLKEVDPNTMESKLIKGLFIAGELLDLHADTGGYNLQAAFSTGWVAGSSLR